jgi:hypothetical protein
MKDFSLIALIGAGAFGAIMGWFVYFLNRYRSGEVQFSDLTTLVGIIGGGSILKLFSWTTENGKPDGACALFGAYSIGLFIGFFGYFVTLLILVNNSGGVFTWTWFLDGRRKSPKSDETIQGARATVAPMSFAPASMDVKPAPQAVHISVQGAPIPQGFMTIDPTAARIIATCEAQWDANSGDCNAFVLAVASVLGATGLAAPADAIVDTITSSPDWRVLQDGVEAKQAADAGQFVIAGLRGAEHNPPRDHGHVVVVVSGGLAQGKYPTGYWGSLGSTPYKNTTINYAWNAADRDSVHYAARSLG